ncbi:MAG TPA: FIST N-terminal domain-containing protein [Oscillospiraceae bacterium]|nr:FIST N-terminal domain-containing protein [Oscillospiraceae bacterium]
MVITLDREGTVDGLRHLLKEVENNIDVSGVLILACIKNDFTPGLINDYLKGFSKPIFGGIFSKILFNREELSRGTIVVGFHQMFNTAVVKKINNGIDLDLLLEHTFEAQSLDDKTMFVFADGVSPHISKLIDGILNSFGLIPNFIGGGAGSLDKSGPCIFTKDGLLENAAVLALGDLRSGIGVAHGWYPVAGPLKVTESEGNTIITLNWQPAFQVYRKTVEKISGKSFDDVDFFDLAKEYPFGIVKMAKEMVVRDPIIVDKQNLICVGDVPTNSFVHILQGNKNSLIIGAADARKFAEESYWEAVEDRTKKPFATFFMDCVSRVLFLENAFKEELSIVYSGCPLFGALTLGEIANTGKNYLEFYNKTSVVGFLEG